MTDTAVTWRGLVLGGDSDIDVHKITGWDDLDDIDTSLDQARARGHGDHPGPVYGRARIVTVHGAIASRQARDELARALMAVTPVDSAVEDLTIETFGRALTAGARLIGRKLPVAEDYASGYVPFTLQWRCPDPLRYGQPRTAATGLPTAGGGLAWPLFGGGFLDWGDPGDPGQITLTNDGTADAPILFTATAGPLGLPGGFEISAVGERLTLPSAVPPGQTIWIDTADGTVLAEGTADRRAELTHAYWLTVPAETSLTVQFTSLGGAYDPDAQLVATVVSAWW